MARVWKHSDPVQRHMAAKEAELLEAPVIQPVRDTPTRRASFQEMKRRQEMEFNAIKRLQAHNDPAKRDLQRVLDHASGAKPIPLAGYKYRRKLPTVAEIADAQDFIGCLEATEEDRHADDLGVSRKPEPKSIYSPAGKSRNGAIDKPNLSSKPKNGGKEIKLWQGNNHMQLDGYMYRGGRYTQK